MITKIKKVYYCEYCKKHFLKKTNHEKHCTLNPNRECRLCGRAESLELLIKKYKKQCELKEFDDFHYGRTVKVIKQPKLEDIWDNVEGCPNCALTILRCLSLTVPPFDMDFDYEKELQKWWDDKNLKEQKNAEYDSMYA